MNTHYLRKRASCRANIGYFGSTLACELTLQSYRTMKITIRSNSNLKIKVNFHEDYDNQRKTVFINKKYLSREKKRG